MKNVQIAVGLAAHYPALTVLVLLCALAVGALFGHWSAGVRWWIMTPIVALVVLLPALEVAFQLLPVLDGLYPPSPIDEPLPTVGHAMGVAMRQALQNLIPALIVIGAVNAAFVAALIFSRRRRKGQLA